MKNKLITIGIIVVLGIAVMRIFPNLFPKETVREGGY